MAESFASPWSKYQILSLEKESSLVDGVALDATSLMVMYTSTTGSHGSLCAVLLDFVWLYCSYQASYVVLSMR